MSILPEFKEQYEDHIAHYELYKDGAKENPDGYEDMAMRFLANMRLSMANELIDASNAIIRRNEFFEQIHTMD